MSFLTMPCQILLQVEFLATFSTFFRNLLINTSLVFLFILLMYFLHVPAKICLLFQGLATLFTFLWIAPTSIIPVHQTHMPVQAVDISEPFSTKITVEIDRLLFNFFKIFTKHIIIHITFPFFI